MQVHAKIVISDQYMASSRAVNAATAMYYQHDAAGPWQVVTLLSLVVTIILQCYDTVGWVI